MKKRCIVLIVLLILTIKFSTAQKYQPGYIITNQLDTAFGLLNNRSYVENAVGCEFKKSSEDKVVSYKPFEINSYWFTDGKYYISKEVTIDSIAQKVFLEYLVKGKANIYYLRNPQGEYYFIQKENESMIPLTAEKYYMNYDESNNKWITTKNENSSNIGESKKYIGTIKYVLRDAPGLYDEIDKSQLDHSDLIKLAVDYHKFICNDENCVVYEKSTKTKMGLAITGMFGTQKYFKNSLAGETKNFDVQSFGISLIILTSQLNERTALKPSVLIGKTNFHTVSYPSSYQTFIIYYISTHLDVPLLIQYDFIAKKRFSAYFNIGPLFEYSETKITSTHLQDDNSHITIDNKEGFEYYDKIFFGESANLGAFYVISRKFFLDVSANYSLTIQTTGLNVNSINAVIGLGYLFNSGQ